MLNGGLLGSELYGTESLLQSVENAFVCN